MKSRLIRGLTWNSDTAPARHPTRGAMPAAAPCERVLHLFRIEYRRPNAAVAYCRAIGSVIQCPFCDLLEENENNDPFCDVLFCDEMEGNKMRDRNLVEIQAGDLVMMSGYRPANEGILSVLRCDSELLVMQKTWYSTHNCWGLPCADQLRFQNSNRVNDCCEIVGRAKVAG